MVFLLSNRTSRRRISLFTFTEKVFAGAVLCFGVVQLPEVWVIQATVMPEDLALLAGNWSGGDGSQFILPIWLVKSSMRNSQTM